MPTYGEVFKYDDHTMADCPQCARRVYGRCTGEKLVTNDPLCISGPYHLGTQYSCMDCGLILWVRPARYDNDQGESNGI